MPIKDIIVQEPAGISVPLESHPTPQSRDRTRGKFVEGRSVPSKQLKAAHRRARTNTPLKVWARALTGSKTVADPWFVSAWFKNKGAAQ